MIVTFRAQAAAMIVDFPKNPRDLRQKARPKPAKAPDSEEEPQADNRTAVNIAALIFVALLVIGSLWAFNKLSDANAMMNCLSSGRSNCNEILHPGAP
jgi:hypothetical protein